MIDYFWRNLFVVHTLRITNHESRINSKTIIINTQIIHNKQIRYMFGHVRSIRCSKRNIELERKINIYEYCVIVACRLLQLIHRPSPNVFKSLKKITVIFNYKTLWVWLKYRTTWNLLCKSDKFHNDISNFFTALLFCLMCHLKVSETMKI